MRLGLDIMDVGTPRLSWRRFRNIIRRLPRKSELGREIFGETVDWGVAEQLLSLLLYVTRMANWSGKGPKPTLIAPASKQTGPGRRRLSVEQFKAWRHGTLPTND